MALFEISIIVVCLGLIVVLLLKAIQHWKRRLFIRSLIMGAGALLVGFAVWLVMPAFALASFLSSRTRCQQNLHQLDLCLQKFCRPPTEYYPMTLSMLQVSRSDAQMFMCPEDRRCKDKPQGVTNVDEWTSYIYVSCLTNELPLSALPTSMPVAICPPIFHRGKGGNVLTADHGIGWYYDPALIDRLIENPLCMCSNPPPELRSNIYVHVSKRLERLSGGKYKSHAVTNWMN